MSFRFSATLNSDGRVTIPADIRERLGVKAGDQIDLELSAPGNAIATPATKKSIFEDLEEFRLPSLGRPLTQQDIDDAVGEAMIEQELRIRNQT